MTKATVYRSHDEVIEALKDRSHAEKVMTSVNKGGKGTFTYIPWNETVKLLDRVFGPFGWSAKIIGTHNDSERGIYRTDIELEVRVALPEGGYAYKTVPGTGVGIASKPEIAESHDTAIKASRSDAISVAAKALGEAFGLFLYDKGDPARNADNSSQPTSSAPRTGQQPNGDRRPSEKQMAVLEKNGYSQEQVDGLTFGQWKAVIDAIFAHETPPIAPAGKRAAGKAPAKTPAPKATEEPEELFDDASELPF